MYWPGLPQPVRISSLEGIQKPAVTLRQRLLAISQIARIFHIFLLARGKYVIIRLYLANEQYLSVTRDRVVLTTAVAARSAEGFPVTASDRFDIASCSLLFKERWENPVPRRVHRGFEDREAGIGYGAARPGAVICAPSEGQFSAPRENRAETFNGCVHAW
jgi:hypothetical protein